MSFKHFIDPLLVGLVADMSGALDEEVECQAKERVDAAKARAEDWRSKAVAADLTRNLREQEIVDLRNQLRYAAARLNVKNGETDEMRRELNIAKLRIDAKQQEIEKLAIELNSARIERDFYEKDSLKLTRLNRQLTEGNSQLFATMLNLSAENDLLRLPLWVKVVGWFAR